MRKSLVLLAIIITLYSCKVQEVNNKSFIGQTDYSTSAKPAVELIKEKMLDENILEFSIEIERSYRGILSSSMTRVIKEANDVKLITVYTDILDNKSQISKTYSSQKFNKDLDKLIKKADKQKILENEYQKINISDNVKQIKFHTRKASGLIDLIEYKK